MRTGWPCKKPPGSATQLVSQLTVESSVHPAGPAPGGNVPVPSFVEDDKRQNKGVKFGHKLPTRREIEAKLGYPAGPAPGGNVPVPSFVEDDKRQNKGYMGASGC